MKRVDGFSLINTLLLLLYAFVCVLPFYYIVVVSFSDPSMVKEGQITLLPRSFSLESYRMILKQGKLFSAFTVSVTRTVLGTSLAVVLESAMGYALSKRHLRGRKLFMLFVVFTMLFSGGMIPTYLIVRYTRIINTVWALIIPRAMAAMHVIILTSFFSSIPDSIEESARIDGANDMRILATLIIPLSLAAIATIALFNAVGHWNALMDGVLYINKDRLKPLQVYLMELVSATRSEEISPGERALPTLSMQTSMIFVATFPIILFYPFIQKYFVKGVMIGAIKG